MTSTRWVHACLLFRSDRERELELGRIEKVGRTLGVPIGVLQPRGPRIGARSYVGPSRFEHIPISVGPAGELELLAAARRFVQSDRDSDSPAIVISDMQSFLDSGADPEWLLEQDSQLNYLVYGGPGVLVCLYSMHANPPRDTLSALLRHRHVLHRGRFRLNAHFIPPAVHSSRDMLEVVLRDLEGSPESVSLPSSLGAAWRSEPRGSVGSLESRRPSSGRC